MISSLRELNLNACREISDKTIVEVANNSNRNLTRIELYWNCRVNDFCIKKLAKMCADLQFVNLSGCKYVSDAAIKVLVDTCPNIYHLNLTRLPKLTDAGLIAIGKANLRNLEYLNLYATTTISTDALI